MNIQERIVYTGQLSDGSDREAKTVYDVTIKQNGKTYFKTFDVEPLEINLTEFEDITPKEDLLQQQIDFLTLRILELMGV